jgi:CheY-like chemotaxis protein
MLTKRILVIDNDVLIQEAVKAILEMMARWQVSIASSGSEGLIKAEVEEPDAILLDLIMPDMDGISTFQKMQANPALKAIPVILLTGKAEWSELAEYQSLGLKGAIAKPFDPMNLAPQIAQILGWDL